MFGVITGFDKTKERLTVVFDKGMNSEDNISRIDEHPSVHFITTYSPYFADELVTTSLSKFEPIDTEMNLRLLQNGRENDRLLAYRTSGIYWGKKRTVIVTQYPPTARKQSYTLRSKLEQLRMELLQMRAKVRKQAPQWRNAANIRERYLRVCERLHISSDYYTIDFNEENQKLSMVFRKQIYRVKRKLQTFGKSIIITDNTDWTTKQIVEANLDRWEVEDCFRQSKHDDLVNVHPLRHWTDSKIRCHLLTCVIALTYLRRMELKLRAKGVARTANDVMEDLHKLHSVISLDGKNSQPHRTLEQPSKTQKETLNALGYKIDTNGVLHSLES